MRLIDGDALEKFLSDAEIEATRQRKYVFASALNTICGNVRNFPTIEPERKKGEWTTEEVAELLFNIFGDDCACNFNGIDEWLPERCKYTEIACECPNPKEKHGCWMQFLLQSGADMRGEEE